MPLSNWQHKYSFAGRVAFDTAVVVDEMNTEGLGAALLYLPGASYPSYDPKDKRDALSIYDLSNYVLSQAKNVEEAKKLIEKVTNTKPNPEFEDRFINHKNIYNDPNMRVDQTALLGLPADYTPPSRFVRSKVLLDNMPVPTNRELARYQAVSVLNSSVVPPVTLTDVTL